MLLFLRYFCIPNISCFKCFTLLCILFLSSKICIAFFWILFETSLLNSCFFISLISSKFLSILRSFKSWIRKIERKFSVQSFVDPLTIVWCFIHLPDTFRTFSRHRPNRFQAPFTHLQENLQTLSRHYTDTFQSL